MQLRKKLTYDIKGKPLEQKAVAFAIFLKLHIGKSSTMENWSVNKVRTLTGISAIAIKKYVSMLMSMGLVSFQGKDNNILVVHKLSSSTKHRNINIDKFKTKTFRDVYNSLRSFIFLIIQAKKEAVKRLFQSIYDPDSLNEYKSAKQTCRHLAEQGIIKGDRYKEYGLSLQRIANDVGCCMRTAQEVVKFAISQNWVKRFHHYCRYSLIGIGKLNLEGIFTFTTNECGYNFYANIYELSPSISDDIHMACIVSKK